MNVGLVGTVTAGYHVTWTLNTISQWSLQKSYKEYFNPSLINKESESHSVMSNSLWPHGLYSPWNFPGQNTGVSSLCLLQGIFPTQGSNPGLLHCRWIVYHQTVKPPEKPMNTGVGSLSLLQGIFPTQESNWGLLHCRRILYQLSHPGSAARAVDRNLLANAGDPGSIPALGRFHMRWSD